MMQELNEVNKNKFLFIIILMISNEEINDLRKKNFYRLLNMLKFDDNFLQLMTDKILNMLLNCCW